MKNSDTSLSFQTIDWLFRLMDIGEQITAEQARNISRFAVIEKEDVGLYN